MTSAGTNRTLRDSLLATSSATVSGDTGAPLRMARAPASAESAARYITPGHDGAGGKKRAIAEYQDGRHGAAGREAGNIYSRAIDGVASYYLTHQSSDRGSLTGAVSGSSLEPVPAAQRIGVRRLLWVEHEKAVLIGQFIHSRALRESVRVLTATVQHHQKRHAVAPADRDRDIQKVIVAVGAMSRRAAHGGSGRQPNPKSKGHATPAGAPASAVAPRIFVKNWITDSSLAASQPVVSFAWFRTLIRP